MSIFTDESPQLCGFEWRDGWGDHKCSRTLNHVGLRHRCQCDFEGDRLTQILCAYCGTQIHYSGGSWIDATDGDGCSGDPETGEVPFVHNPLRAHKAEPQDASLGVSACKVCGSPVKRVPGGHGPTWIHTETGTVLS